jgi:hypothetical protein
MRSFLNRIFQSSMRFGSRDFWREANIHVAINTPLGCHFYDGLDHKSCRNTEGNGALMAL